MLFELLVTLAGSLLSEVRNRETLQGYLELITDSFLRMGSFSSFM